VGAQIRAWEKSHITIAGGTIGDPDEFPEIRARGGLIEIIGSGFAVDGIPVAFGDVSGLSGTLTGLLLSGELLSNTFERANGGVIRLVAVPEPATGLILGAGLIALAARTRRARRSR
jgi:hypothetical protein